MTESLTTTKENNNEKKEKHLLKNKQNTEKITETSWMNGRFVNSGKQFTEVYI